MCAKRIDATHLTRVEQTALLTLYARALDSRRKTPILGDALADDIASQIDYDFERLRVTKEQYNTAVRAGELDLRVKRFIAVADGVLPFIEKDAVIELFNRLTDHFPSGEIVFNGYTTLAARLMAGTPSIKALGLTATFGFDDPQEPEQWAPKLKLVEESYLLDSPLAARMPWAWRVLGNLMSLSPGMKREAGRILGYRFGEAAPAHD